jgi:hypothetical protein
LRNGRLEEVFIDSHESGAQQGFRVIYFEAAVVSVCNRRAQTTDWNFEITKHVVGNWVIPTIDRALEEIRGAPLRL